MKRNSDLIILVILWIIAIVTIITSMVKHYEMDYRNYLGFALLAGITALRYFKIRYLKLILGLFLILGTFNVFSLTWKLVIHFDLSVFGTDFSSLGLHPLILAVLLFYIFTNLKGIFRFFRNTIVAKMK